MKRAESYKVRASLTSRTDKKQDTVFLGLLYYNDCNGKRISKTVTLKSKTEDSIKNELEQHQNALQNRLNIILAEKEKHSILEEYSEFTEWTKNRVKITTYDGYVARKTYVDRYFSRPDTPKYIEDLTKKDIANYYIWLTFHGRKNGKPLSTHTVNDAKALFNFFIEYENELKDGKLVAPRKDSSVLNTRQHAKKEVAFLTSEQCREFLNFLKYGEYSDLYSIVLVGLYTGMRRSELIGLQWKSVNLKKNLLIVERTVVKRNSGKPHISNQTKTEAGHRVVAMCIAVSEELAKLRTQRPVSHKPEEVFLNKKGKMWNPDNLSKRFKKALIACFGEYEALPLHFHSMRATTATLLRDSGMSLEDIQKFIGHKPGNRVTIDHYYGTSQHQIQNLKEHLDAMI